jgi:hypothetical protein
MKLIESKTLATATKSLEFISIPQDATDLFVVISARSTRTGSDVDDGFDVTLNNTSANYSERALRGFGSGADTLTGAASSSFTRINIPSSAATSNTFTNSSIYIPNYTGATAKSVSIDAVMENNATLSFMFLTAGLWNDTAAITSIKFTAQVADLAIGTTISLYKILKGSDGIVTTS